MNHYYTDNSDLDSDRKEFTYYFGNEVFRFTTDIGVFSKNNVDYGSYILIRSIVDKDLARLRFRLRSDRYHPQAFPSGYGSGDGRGEFQGCGAFKAQRCQ